MKNIFKISALALACLTVLGLSGCTREELSTDQLSDTQVKLGAFAPNPVARGGALRILGSNLQNVQQVEIPGVEPITEIEVVSSGRVSEIRIIVPVDGPEVGPIAIVAGDTKLTSKAELEYTEPIVFDEFSPLSAMPGDVLTIKGDYMNNIKQIIFEGGEVVKEFESQSRYELQVKVPATAVTGKIILGDVDEANNPDGLVSNLFYSEKELTIGDPVVVSKERGVIKAESEVVVTGNYLNMIESVSFGGEDAVFSLSTDAKTITAVLPKEAIDGDLLLVSYAGKEFKAGTYETLVPSALKVTAKNRFKAGQDVIISGKDLDLVTEAKMGEVTLTTTFDKDKGVIAFSIPSTALDGPVTLVLANQKTIDTEALELVKPVIESVTPLELYAGDENIKIVGKDLDLVKTATLGGNPIEIKDGATADAIELVTTLSSISGKVALILENGTSVEYAQEVKMNYHSLVIVTEMPAGQHIGEEVVLKGSNFDLVENIFIGEEKVTKYSLRTANEVKFLMPWNKVGNYNLKFHLFSGDVETVATPIEVQLERQFTRLWEGRSAVSWAAGAVKDLAYGAYNWSNVSVGASIIATLEVTADNAVIRFGNGNWKAIPSTLAFSNSDAEGNLALSRGMTTVAVKLAAADLAELVNNNGLVICGDGYTITSIDLVTEISQEKVVWEGSEDPTGGRNLELGTDNGWWIDNNLAVGQKVKLYFTCADIHSWWIQVFSGHWDPMISDLSTQFNQDNRDGSLGYVEFEVTPDFHKLMTKKQQWGSAIILQGMNITFTRITLL